VHHLGVVLSAITEAVWLFVFIASRFLELLSCYVLHRFVVLYRAKDCASLYGILLGKVLFDDI